jgi:trk system potassium uptake protein TrkH
MGIVVLTIVFLPILGVKGLHFIRIEAPGPTVERIAPRIAETTLVLWLIYLGLTFTETLLLMLGRMNLFDALTHTFGTLATGGFSPKNRSGGHYSSKYIHIIITIFMMLAGTNFNLYYRLLSGRFREIKRNTELRAYLGIFFTSSILIALVLNGSVYESFGKSLRYGSFQVASIFSTTGFSTADFDPWPAMAKGILFALMFIGGSSGSTGGGIKVIRIVTLFKIGINEMRYFLHQRGVYTIKINDMPVRKDIAYTIAGFVFLYISFLIVTTLVVTSGGYDLVTSFSTALVTVGNIGPGFGKIGPTLNYSFYPDYIKWFLSFAMMVGRLEVYTVFIIFTPWFWKR